MTEIEVETLIEVDQAVMALDEQKTFLDRSMKQKIGVSQERKMTCIAGHNSAHCMYPEKGHKFKAKEKNSTSGCMLYKQLYTS